MSNKTRYRDTKRVQVDMTVSQVEKLEDLIETYQYPRTMILRTGLNLLHRIHLEHKAGRKVIIHDPKTDTYTEWVGIFD